MPSNSSDKSKKINLTKEDKRQNLEWIIERLQSARAEIFLEEIIKSQPYSAADVRKWGKNEPELYDKMRDLLFLRIHKAIQDKKVEKQIGLRHLAAFHDYTEKTEQKVKGDVVVKIMPEGAKL